MTKAKRNVLILLCACFLLLMAAPGAFANSAEPPRLIVIVASPPDDLTLLLRFDDDSGMVQDAYELSKKQTAWEAQYRFTYGMVAATRPALDKATLIASSHGSHFEYPIPEGMLKRYNNIMTLDYDKQTITDGQTFTRSASLVSMRVGLTLLIEGLIFFLFLYREKRSWLAFLIINLITQGALNIALNQSFTGSYLLFALIVYEVLVMIIELAAFSIAVKEHRKLRTIGYVILANIASLILGGFLITYLPV